MRLKLEKVTNIDQIQVNDTLLHDGSYPTTVECIDGRNGSMYVYIKCILTKSEFKYDFAYVNKSINQNRLFKIIGE